MSTCSRTVSYTHLHEVTGDLESSLRGALTAAALEHIELAVLDGELHVLHVAVVISGTPHQSRKFPGGRQILLCLVRLLQQYQEGLLFPFGTRSHHR